MTTSELHDMSRRLDAMPGHQRLLIASELMKQGQSEIAVVIAENVVLEFKAAQFLGLHVGSSAAIREKQ